ncbi:radical SAM protein [Candidatus Woesearchaeota archaeon]|nr:radical SAM protein [Candidatus Woesearchaeota archaeon]MCF7900979.1 radical SAM protein [Candidatus Woesearchaeota archaeon]MCF8013305.1 radical SAM protein [Candidatus Woesearchaeota archaeon]
MKKVLLIHSPFCTPASPPYALTGIFDFLKNNVSSDSVELDILDLNIEFHKLKFQKFQKLFQNKISDKHNNEEKGISKNIFDLNDYDVFSKEYDLLTSKTYSDNNKMVLRGEKPEFFDDLLNLIKEKKPDIVAFSIVYSSQVFYTTALLEELKDFETILGGPSVNDKLSNLASFTLKNEVELLEHINQEKVVYKNLNFETIPDFSIYNLNDYFSPFPSIPIKTSNTCFYKQCVFCSHFTPDKYFEFSLDIIKKTIEKSNQKYFFLIDDMIPKNRLLALAEIFKPLNIKWGCQLKPTGDLTYDVLKTLNESGLTFVLWGVESGNQRVLDLMRKGSKVDDLINVLKNSHAVGIKNITYMLFGFPTETKDECISSFEFLKNNSEFIDLVSPAIFGLQKGTYIYNNPEKFGIRKIIEEKRTLLEPRITYEVSSGLTHEDVVKLKKNYKKTLDKINKYPKSMNFFREHMFFVD